MKAIVLRVLKAALFAAALLLLRGERPGLVRAAEAANVPLVGYANPAAIYCGSLGYQYEVEHGKNGDRGVCKLPNANVCDGWDFLAGRCGQTYSICAKQGLEIETRSDGNSEYSTEYAVCKDKAGKRVGTVADLAKVEDKATKTGCIKKPPVTVEDGNPLPQAVAGIAPAAFDWRARPKGNYLTNVRDQGQCGSCWAFSAVGVTEAVLNIAHDAVGNNFDLSEQYLVSDCSGAGNCCGGSPKGALDYIQSSGIPDEGCLQYVDGNYDGRNAGCSCSGGTCSGNCVYRNGGKCSDKTCGNRCSNYATRLVKVNSVGSVPATRDTIKNLLISKGPLSVTLSMSGSFDSTTHVYKCAAGAQVNHAVVLVGYNDAGGYWIARNSWGSNWNGDGYFNVGYGQCSIENDIYYVGMATSSPITYAPNSVSPVKTPTYTWSSFTGATQYQYEVLQGTASVHKYTVDSSICNATTCSQTPQDELGYGSYSWHVRAYVNGVWRDYSSQSAFSVTAPVVPDLNGPTGVIVDRRPIYNWAKVVFATQYQYQLWQGPTLIYAKTVPVSACAETDCTHSPTKLLAAGSYKWRARAMVGGAWKPYSAFQPFGIRKGFSSQFNGDANGWVTHPGAPWEAGSTAFYTLGQANASSASRPQIYSNFTYQARIKRVGVDDNWGGQAGLVVRGTPRFDSFNDWKTAYEFVYSSYYGEFAVWRGVGGSWTILKDWTLSPAIARNDWNTLAVAARGTSLKFYINGSLVWDGVDGKIASGQVGLWNWNGGASPEELDVDWATLVVGTPTGLTANSIEEGQQTPEIGILNPYSKNSSTVP